MRREVEAWVEGYEGRSGGIYVRVLTSDPETEGLRPPGIMYIPGIFNNRNKIKKMFTTSDKSVKRVDFRPRD